LGKKKFYNSLKTGPNYFLQHLKNKILLNFVIFVATKKGVTTNFFHLSLLLLFLDPGSGMGKNQDPGSGTKHPGSATLKRDFAACDYLSEAPSPPSSVLGSLSPFVQAEICVNVSKIVSSPVGARSSLN
jgi:hypothetical protein